MSDSTSTISPASPVKVTGTAASAPTDPSIRAVVERDVAAARKAVDTTVSTDVAKVESLFSKVKPYLGYAGLLVLGVLIGHFIK